MPDNLTLVWVKPDTLPDGESHRVMIQDDRIIDVDFNVHGIAEAVMHPADPAGSREFVYVSWSNDQDCFRNEYMNDPAWVAVLPD